MAEQAARHPRFEQLQKEHQELEARLEKLNARLWLSMPEQIERKRIQKLKLLKKDFMTALQREGACPN